MPFPTLMWGVSGELVTVPWGCHRLKSPCSSLGSVFIVSGLVRGMCVKGSMELTKVRWSDGGFSFKAAALCNHGLSSLAGATLTFYPDSLSHLYPCVPARFSLLQSDSCTLPQSNVCVPWGWRSLLSDSKHWWRWSIWIQIKEHLPSVPSALGY